MTKKDYIIIATAISQAVREVPAQASAKSAAKSIIEHVSHALQIDNPKFDARRFIAYIEKLVGGK